MSTIMSETAPTQDLNDSGCVQDSSVCESSYVGQAQLLDLSDDVLLYILKHCSPQDLKALGYTCPRLGALICDHTLWQRVDARGSPTGPQSLHWLLANCLCQATTELKLEGYVDTENRCLGIQDPCPPLPLINHNRLGDSNRGVIYKYANLVDNVSFRVWYPDLPRFSISPRWPDSCELERLLDPNNFTIKGNEAGSNDGSTNQASSSTEASTSGVNEADAMDVASSGNTDETSLTNMSTDEAASTSLKIDEVASTSLNVDEAASTSMNVDDAASCSMKVDSASNSNNNCEVTSIKSNNENKEHIFATPATRKRAKPRNPHQRSPTGAFDLTTTIREMAPELTISPVFPNESCASKAELPPSNAESVSSQAESSVSISASPCSSTAELFSASNAESCYTKDAKVIKMSATSNPSTSTNKNEPSTSQISNAENKESVTSTAEISPKSTMISVQKASDAENVTSNAENVTSNAENVNAENAAEQPNATDRRGNRAESSRIIEAARIAAEARLEYLMNFGGISDVLKGYPQWSDPAFTPAPTNYVPKKICQGPQFTFTTKLLNDLKVTCSNLTTLFIEYCNIDYKTTNITNFPPKLKKLSLKGTRCFNQPIDLSYLGKIQDHLPDLEYLDVSQCEWIEPSALMGLSKVPKLQELRMARCIRLTECVAYASLATRYGFRKLKVLDVRESPLADSEVSALGWLPVLEELYVAPPTEEGMTPEHTHSWLEPLPRFTELQPWETEEPEYYKTKLPEELEGSSDSVKQAECQAQGSSSGPEAQGEAITRQAQGVPRDVLGSVTGGARQQYGDPNANKTWGKQRIIVIQPNEARDAMVVQEANLVPAPDRRRPNPEPPEAGPSKRQNTGALDLVTRPRLNQGQPNGTDAPNTIRSGSCCDTYPSQRQEGSYRPLFHNKCYDLVTDSSVLRFGRGDLEHVVHIGQMPMDGEEPRTRPDISNLRILSITGYRSITDRSLMHLATAAPHLISLDLTGTNVTTHGVEVFKGLRPDCQVKYSRFSICRP